MQAQHYSIIQNTKPHAGFDHYQVQRLHHHLAMVHLVLLFMLEARLALDRKI